MSYRIVNEYVCTDVKFNAYPCSKNSKVATINSGQRSSSSEISSIETCFGSTKQQVLILMILYFVERLTQPGTWHLYAIEQKPLGILQLSLAPTAPRWLRWRSEFDLHGYGKSDRLFPLEIKTWWTEKSGDSGWIWQIIRWKFIKFSTVRITKILMVTDV